MPCLEPTHSLQSESTDSLRRTRRPPLQGLLFGLVGFSAGIVGTTLSNGLIAARKAADPAFQPQNEVTCRSCSLHIFWSS